MTIYVNQNSVIPDLTPRQEWIMPRHQAVDDLIIMKRGGSSYQESNGSSFSQGMLDTQFGERESAFHSFTSTLVDKTVMEVDGESGVITHIITPTVTSNGQKITVHVTVDGITTDYEFSYLRTGFRGVLGGARAGVTGSDNTGFHGTVDYGSGGSTTDISFFNPLDSGHWDNNPSQLYILTPKQTLDDGIGIPFKNSMRVGISNAGVDVMTISKYAWVVYVKDHGGLV